MAIYEERIDDPVTVIAPKPTHWWCWQCNSFEPTHQYPNGTILCDSCGYIHEKDDEED